MKNSLVSLLVDKLFDYSGIFPPEAKSLDDALIDSSKFKKNLTFNNLVNADIVVNQKDLAKLTPEKFYARGFNKDSQINIAVLSSQDSKLDLEPIKEFNESYSNFGIKIISYEVKVENLDIIKEEFQSNNNLINSLDILISLEPNLALQDWLKTLLSFCDAIKNFGPQYALKIRGTGPTAIDNIRIVKVIAEVARNKINLKATGGLHHPIIESQYDNNLAFLGLTLALFFAYKYQKEFNEDNIHELLNISDPRLVKFGDQIVFRSFTLSQLEIMNLKSLYKFSIGSCNLNEPDEDLVRLFS